MFNFRFQYPHKTKKEKEILDKFNQSKFVDFIFALKKWRIYYQNLLKRSLRSLSDRYSHFTVKGHIKLPASFIFNKNRAIPRGIQVAGKYYSFSYACTIEEIPLEVKNEILKYKSILEIYFCDQVNVANPMFFQNRHVPQEIQKNNE